MLESHINSRPIIMSLIHLICYWLLCRKVTASEFNKEYAASVFTNIEHHVSIPWTRVNNILAAAYSTRWSYVYDGDIASTTTNTASDLVTNHVHQNNSMHFFWTIFKSFEDEASYSILSFFIGFENGKFMGYGAPAGKEYDEVRHGKIQLMTEGNSTCPEWNITGGCLEWFGGNSTDPVTGRIAGKSTIAAPYDCRGRGWYVNSKAYGSLWSEPYEYALYNILGISAARPVVTNEGEFIGVIGADYSLSSIDNMLEDLASGDNDLTIFILDNKGLLIASSIKGAAVDHTLSQIPANESAYPLIAGVAKEFEKSKLNGGGGGWVASNGTILTVHVEDTGLYWAQSLELRDSYGLHWHVVIVELVRCDKGYYTPTKFHHKDCVECVDGADCLGGSNSPYPQAGYWIDRSAYKYGDQVHPCSWDTCLGFENKFDILTKQKKKNKKENDDEMSLDEIYINCWSEFDFNHTLCKSDALQCSRGSTGPLCGSCLETYTYNSALRMCVHCNSSSTSIPAFIGLLLFICLLIICFFYFLRDQLRYIRQHEKKLKKKEIKSIDMKFKQFKLFIFNHPPMNVLKHIDQGTIKVLWATIQILGTISWNLSIKYPSPFDNFLKSMALLQFDFFALDCHFKKANFITRVLTSSFSPILLSIIDVLFYFVRRAWFVYTHRDEVKDDDWKTKKAAFILLIHNQHLHVFLFLGFVVLPTVSMLQFVALECVHIHDGASYLRMDTSISCNSAHYKRFVILNSFLIIIYQSVPLVWFVLLYRIRQKINPHGLDKFKEHHKKPKNQNIAFGRKAAGGSPSMFAIMESFVNLTMNDEDDDHSRGPSLLSEIEVSAVRGRNGDPTIQHLAFLWRDYVPHRWFYEVFEMYRRIFYIAVIPLLSRENSIRAAIGCLVSMMFVSFVREASPFIRGATNVLLNIAQNQILITFFGSFIIATDSLETLQLSEAVLGVLLLACNILILLLVGLWSLKRFSTELKHKKWRRVMNETELNVLQKVMQENNALSYTKEKKPSTSPRTPLTNKISQKISFNSFTLPPLITKVNMEKSNDDEGNKEGLLNKFLIDSRLVIMTKKIGAGAFGEVFKGTYRNEDVAIKTMIEVTEKTAKIFRAEIMLCAKLKHPNIVNFVGCCFDKDLTCLILEYVKGGCLGDILIAENAAQLDWIDPLLRLAIDIAKGMTYLHSNKRIDYTTQQKEIILHRDLKPENVLITEFLSAKITDFGTSREKASDEDVTMTAVGTPLFCAPEIARGDHYDEKVDVYSFGLVLLDMAVEEQLIDFIGERYRIDYKKKVKPKQPMRFIRAMTEEGWRPLKIEDDTDHDIVLDDCKTNEKDSPGPRAIVPIPNDDKTGDDDSEDEENSQYGFYGVLPFAPTTIKHLIVACCHPDPTQRPSFADVLTDLETNCFQEVNSLEYSVYNAISGRSSRSASHTSAASYSSNPIVLAQKNSQNQLLDENKCNALMSLHGNENETIKTNNHMEVGDIEATNQEVNKYENEWFHEIFS